MTRPAPGYAQTLTDRQQEILRLLADGLDAHEIAARLHLSYGTIKTHITGLLETLGARNRTHAVAIGFRTGLLR